MSGDSFFELFKKGSIGAGTEAWSEENTRKFQGLGGFTVPMRIRSPEMVRAEERGRFWLLRWKW